MLPLQGGVGNPVKAHRAPETVLHVQSARYTAAVTRTILMVS